MKFSVFSFVIFIFSLIFPISQGITEPIYNISDQPQCDPKTNDCSFSPRSLMVDTQFSQLFINPIDHQTLSSKTNTITWNKVPDATLYQIILKYTDDNSNRYDIPAMQLETETETDCSETFNFDSLQPNQSYQLTIIAFDSERKKLNEQTITITFDPKSP